MNKSAEEILEVMDPKKVEYEVMAGLRSRDCYSVLCRILNNVEALREMARDYHLLMERGLPGEDGYPKWAYAIAYRLYDPAGKFGREGKAGLLRLCREMACEFESEDRYVTRSLAAQKGVPRYLAQAARDLLGE